MIHPARAIANPGAEPASAPYGAARAAVMSPQGFDAAMREISSWPGYAPTPLLSLDGLAKDLGIGGLHYKDERGRFGLGSFKALGGAYAVANVLRDKVMRARGLSGVTSSELLSGVYRDIVGAATVTCATDGNHGRSVAWGAQLFGCRCVIYVHETVSQGRRDAIARYGAQVLEVKGNYDDAVRHAATTAAVEGWTVVSDTSYPGYRDIPLDVMVYDHIISVAGVVFSAAVGDEHGAVGRRVDRCADRRSDVDRRHAFAEGHDQKDHQRRHHDRDGREEVNDLVGVRGDNVFFGEHLDAVGDGLQKSPFPDAVWSVTVLDAAEQFSFEECQIHHDHRAHD